MSLMSTPPFSHLLAPFTNTYPVSDDSSSVREVFKAVITMFITALEMLHESGLIGPASPLPQNLNVLTLHMLDFMHNTASDFDLEGVDDLVRAAEDFGIVVESVEQIEGVDEGVLEKMRGVSALKRKRGRKFDNWKTFVSKHSCSFTVL